MKQFLSFLIITFLYSTISVAQKAPSLNGKFNYSTIIEGGVRLFPFEESGTLQVKDQSTQKVSINYEQITRDHISLGLERNCVDTLNLKLGLVSFNFTNKAKQWELSDSTLLILKLDSVAKLLSNEMPCSGLVKPFHTYIEEGLTFKEIFQAQHPTIATLAELFVNLQNFRPEHTDSTFNLGFAKPDGTPFIFPYTIEKKLEKTDEFSAVYIIHHNVELKEWGVYYKNQVVENLKRLTTSDSEVYKTTMKELNSFNPKLSERFVISVKNKEILSIQYRKEQTLMAKGGQTTTINYFKEEMR